MLKFNFLSMPIIFSMYKTGILCAGLNKKIQVYIKQDKEKNIILSNLATA